MPIAISVAAITAAVVFTLFFTFRKETDSSQVPLSIAVILTAALELFDLLTFYNPEQVYLWKKFSLTAEALVVPAWLWFSLSYARLEGEPRKIPLTLRFLLAVSPFLAGATLFLPAGFFLYSPDFVTEKILFLSDYGFCFYLLLLIYLVIALINLESTFVHATHSSRWKIKFELLGAGAFLAVLVIYYSQGLLFRTINMQLFSTRSVVLLVSLAMIAYSRLKRGSGVKVYVSQQMACRSAVLLAVGLYIIGFGLAGEGMKYFGDGFQRAMILAAVFLAGLALFVLLLSETVKRKVKVFINKNFYQNKYDYRNQWLQFTEHLSSSHTSEELLRSIVSEFCDTFGMGTGALFILNQERDTYQQTIGIGMDAEDITFGANDPAIESLVGSHWIVDLRNNISVTENERNRDFLKEKDACFVVPLFMNEVVDGFIMLGRPLNANEIYGCEDFDLMRTLAKQASSALMNLRLSDQLACSRELAAIGKVSTFVMHDLKNLVSTVSLLLENAQEHIAVPAFQSDLLMSLGNTIIKMRTIISRLKHLPEKNSLQLAPVDLLQMAREAAAMVGGRKLEVTGTSVFADVDREELQKVALNLMLNAVEATEGNAPVTVEVGSEDAPYFRVKDEGCGIAPAFLEHVMFTPFVSTKKTGLGIGLYQSKQIVEAHGGTIEVVSTLDQGSEFTVWLPKTQAVA
ncbi:MAG: PEP-CTERM system histidine kinase PrsK [Desulfuromonadaceae bacterium]|nr:PEP-CTERM system histidine kinase PrsK [Desulfuromonadaceae bacterium]MDD2848989.1 PEP-CTERM system histidine kinase PrsK [Desulfuromonadaceae bacterium]MDD4130338.1 PEP-CTERM system histidine kinase PrsK [Desulfuromonadaceae bacterium]